MLSFNLDFAFYKNQKPRQVMGLFLSMILYRITKSAITLSIISQISCLRYTPSREEIYRSSSNEVSAGESTGSSKNNSDFLVLTEEAFLQHEQKQYERLKLLIDKRKEARASVSDSSYHIGIGDLLEFNVFDVSELNRSVRVRPSGSISLPLIGTVIAAGFTETELQDEVAKRLDHYLQAPQVSVFIAEYASQKVSVIGEVAKPGTYGLKRDDYSLIEVLSEAGGRTGKASGYIVLIPSDYNALGLNKTSEKNVASADNNKLPNTPATILDKSQSQFGIEIPFDELIGSADKPPINIPLVGGDTIVVPEAGMVQIDGEVTKPGSYQLASRMTLLGAIAAAGSITYSANVNNVEVIRELEPGKKAILTMNLQKVALGGGQDVRLRDGDVVRVPSHGTRFVTRQVIDAVNSIVNFGVGGSVNLAR